MSFPTIDIIYLLFLHAKHGRGVYKCQHKTNYINFCNVVVIMFLQSIADKMTSTILAPQTYHCIVEKHLKTSDNECIDFSVEHISEEVSECGKRLVLSIRVKSGKEIKNLRFFVKLFPKASHEISYVQQKTGLDKEIFAYTVYFENTTKYLLTGSPETSRLVYFKPNEIIVLKHLADEGYDVARAKMFDENHIKLALEKIAELHATSLAYEELKSKEVGKEYRLGNEFNKQLKEGYYIKDKNLLFYNQLQGTPQDILYLIDKLPENKISKEQLKIKFTERLEEIFEIFYDHSKFRNVFSHGNLQHKNMVFKYEGDKPVSCKLINFNFIRYAPPALDVLLFLWHVTGYQTRKSSLENYLTFYYKMLKEQVNKYNVCLKNILSRDEFDSTCDEFLPAVKLMHTHKTVSKIISQYTENLLSSSTTGETRLNFLSDLLQSDQNFKRSIANEVDTIVDVIINDVVTLEDCFKILRVKLGTTNYDLKNYELIPFEEKSGYLGEHYHLNMTVIVNGECCNIKFFVKCLAKIKSQREFSKSSGTAFKENRMFTKLIPLVKKHGINLLNETVPTAYLCKQDGTIVLNHLGAEGFKQFDKVVSLDYDAAKLMVQTMAKFHASFLILEEKISQLTGKNYRLIDDFQQEFKEVFYAESGMPVEAAKASVTGLCASVEEFFEETGKLTREQFLEKVTHTIRNQCKNVVTSTRFRNTVCHGDAWINNLLFKECNGVLKNCVLVDFQSYRYISPANDILFTIYVTTDRSFRKEYMKEMLDVYYAEMTKSFNNYDVDINKVLPYSDFIESCKVNMEMVLVQTLTHFQVIMLGKELINELFSNAGYLWQTFFTNKYEFMKRAFQIDPPFKKRNYECLLDLVDYYESQLL